MTILHSELLICIVCGIGDLIGENKDKREMIVYGRNGPRKVTHIGKRCNNKNKNVSCGAGYYYGYYTFQRKQIFHNDALRENAIKKFVPICCQCH